MQQKKGYVSFVLHAHLPFIHHPESDDYLEESWLYEAISETYIPLLTNFQKLVDEGVDFRITMSMTPPLLSMLDNKLLQRKYIKYLKKLIELSKKDGEIESWKKLVEELKAGKTESVKTEIQETTKEEIEDDNLLADLKATKVDDLKTLAMSEEGGNYSEDDLKGKKKDEIIEMILNKV